MKKNDKNIHKDISSISIEGQPETTFDMVAKYGTYEIQPTSDTDNEYPLIAQGYNKKLKKSDGENPVH